MHMGPHVSNGSGRSCFWSCILKCGCRLFVNRNGSCASLIKTMQQNSIRHQKFGGSQLNTILDLIAV